MLQKKIQSILRDGENLTVEFKECSSKLSDSVFETVSSFSNRYGGYLILGMRDVVVLDGSSCHKSAKAREIVEQAGCRLLFLPPYSPDFNPDEQLWSKTKSILRKLKHRTVDKLLEAVYQAVGKVSAKDCRGFFKHCGYAI
jgi:transposase